MWEQLKYLVKIIVISNCCNGINEDELDLLISEGCFREMSNC